MIGHIARKGIIMDHAIAFELMEKGLELFVADMFHNGSDVGSDQVEVIRIGLQHLRDKGATSELKVLQNGTLVFKTFPRMLTKKVLVHLSIKANPNDGSFGVFHLTHARQRSNPSKDGRRALRREGPILNKNNLSNGKLFALIYTQAFNKCPLINEIEKDSSCKEYAQV